LIMIRCADKAYREKHPHRQTPEAKRSEVLFRRSPQLVDGDPSVQMVLVIGEPREGPPWRAQDPSDVGWL
jgi:hypothetical protein